MKTKQPFSIVVLDMQTPVGYFEVQITIFVYFFVPLMIQHLNLIFICLVHLVLTSDTEDNLVEVP